MEEHPILFSGPMVRAILEGCKTQTRRVIRPQFGQAWGWGVKHGDNIFSVHVDIKMPDGTWKWIRCPYGQLGDLLWVRETFAMGIPNGESIHANYIPHYRADGEIMPHWTPSIHMPRWASRLTLRITDVRVQRVQEITEEDAKAEGMEPDRRCKGYYRDIVTDAPVSCAREAFLRLWDSINAKRGYSWRSNPWVWAITFSPLDAVKERI